MSETPPVQESVNPATTTTSPASGTGLAPNVAAALSYVLGWITGLLFFVIEKDNPYVKFHAMQSILMSVAIIALYILMAVLLVPMMFAGLGFMWILMNIVYLAVFVLWIFMIIQASQGKVFKLPVLGTIAEKQAGL